MPFALVVVEGATGNAQGPEKEAHELGACNTPMAASAAAEDDVESSGQSLSFCGGGWGRGLGHVVVDDGGGSDVEGPRNGEDHVGKTRVFEKSRLDGGVEAAMAAQFVCVGVEQMGDGDGNVHAPKCLEVWVGGVLPHPSADESVGGVVVVGGEVRCRSGDTVKVYLEAEVGNGVADTGIRDQVNARWWHRQWSHGNDARDAGLCKDRVVGIQR